MGAKKKKNVKKRKNGPKNGYEDSWIYILLLSTLLILIEALKDYTFSLEQLNLTYSIFLLPIIYLVTNYITKKYGYQRSIVAISISGLSMIAFVGIMDFSLGKAMDLSPVCGSFCAYVVSQLVNLMIYEFLIKNTNMPWYLVFLNYMFSLIIFYMFYTLIYLNMIILENFWIGYFSVLLIQAIMCSVLTIIDKKIPVGLDEESD